MEATPNGRSGQIVLLNVEEENAAVIDNVPILCHNMAEKIAKTLGQQLRQKTVIKTDAQVKVTFFYRKILRKITLFNRPCARHFSLSQCFS